VPRKVRAYCKKERPFVFRFKLYSTGISVANNERAKHFTKLTKVNTSLNYLIKAVSHSPA